jgi:hypothetical protein
LPSCPRRWRATGLIRSLTSVDGPSCLRTHHAETALVSSCLFLFAHVDCSSQT